jgi:chemotaxis protein methyltransferase CheR
MRLNAQSGNCLKKKDKGITVENEIYRQVRTSVMHLLNIDLTHYKDEQMRRRLDAWLIRVDEQDWSEYFKRVARDANELSRFRNYLTINVSEFFRDTDRWKYLKNDFLPMLLSGSRRFHPGMPGIRAWSCGCSLGQEIYSLAMVLDEVSPGVKHSFLATDIDRGALAIARARGPYGPENIVGINQGQREKYLEPGGPPYYVRPALSRNIIFREQNMVTDPFEGNFDLIICRNVIIYFTPDAKDILYRKFYDALRPGGVLFLGGTEIIPRSTELPLVSRGFSFYVKE